MAEALLRHQLCERLGDEAGVIDVGSAGTGALAGEPMEAFAAAALRGVGVEPGEFVARDVTAEILDVADLVLTATRQHRSLVATAQPSVIRRVFTIKEFARLAASLEESVGSNDAAPTDRLRELVVRVAGQRGLAPPAQPSDDDVADPYGMSARHFTATAADLLPAVTITAERLARAVG